MSQCSYLNWKTTVLPLTVKEGKVVPGDSGKHLMHQSISGDSSSNRESPVLTDNPRKTTHIFNFKRCASTTALEDLIERNILRYPESADKTFKVELKDEAMNV